MLIDTHVLLWYVAGDRRRIGRQLQERIETESMMVSVASVWEIAIKTALGKLDAPEDLPARIERLGFKLLPVAPDHAWRVRHLPFHHRDPFDRLLIAQAQLERLPILTADDSFGAYDVAVVWSGVE
jgi:PIN domain nuclease of toxin-antitoxin system